MNKKIIVAGGGHGGIAAGALLAKEGFDVTVYEKNSRKNMGYDWTDIFDKKGFTEAGMTLPEKDKYKIKNKMTFFPPSMRVGTIQGDVPQDKLEIQMERKAIYDHIISHAEKCGVKFEYETEVFSPIIKNDRVVGINTSKGERYADLVIDAAGINSPVRRNLMSSCVIQKDAENCERIYIWRAFFNKTAEVKENKFRVYLAPNNKLQLCWVADDETHTDVLIGRFQPFNMDDVEEILTFLRKKNPDIGEELLRGNQFVEIPLRQPLSVLVWDGYAAIGDSAFMTIPLIGSGIANTLKASKILAYAIIADKDGNFTKETLWKYQRDFYKKLGRGLAPIAYVMDIFIKSEFEDIDFLFEEKILEPVHLAMSEDTNNLLAFMSTIKPHNAMYKLFILRKNKRLRRNILKMCVKICKATVVTFSMPKKYNQEKVISWSDKYNSCFKERTALTPK